MRISGPDKSRQAQVSITHAYTPKGAILGTDFSFESLRIANSYSIASIHE